MMNKLVEKIIEKNMPVLFRYNDMEQLGFEKRELEKYVQNAVVFKYLHNIYKDIYTLSNMYRKILIPEGMLAQMIIPGSYTSLYYVLSDENWIPEAVYNVSSVIVGDKITVDTDEFGSFFYYGICDRLILKGVRKQVSNIGFYYKATPLKALCDYVCMFKKDWKGIDAPNDYLRVKYHKMEELTKEDFDEIQGSYNIKNVEVFIESLRKDLKV